MLQHKLRLSFANITQGEVKEDGYRRKDFSTYL